MKEDVILIASSLAWAFSLLAQECLGVYSQTHRLWMSSFVAAGESLFLLFSERYGAKELFLYNSFGYASAIVCGVLKGFVIIGLLYVVEVIGPLRTLLAWYAFSSGFYCVRYDGCRLIHLSICLALALIYWSFILEDSDLVLEQMLSCGLLGILCLMQYAEVIFKTERDCKCKAFEKFVASVLFAFLGWIMTTDRVSDTVLFFSWPFFPFLAIFAGLGKSFFLSSSELRFSPVGVISSLIVFLPKKIIHLTFTNVASDLVILFSAGIVVFYTFQTQNNCCCLPFVGSSDAFQRYKKSIISFTRSVATYFSFHRRERKLFAFLVLTMFVMIIELFYGISVNSLGLIADAFHMFIDSGSIFVGLCAAFAASWPPNEKTHPFGYARYEILGGFVNGVLLLCIALFVVVESIERLISPPEIEAAYLIHVSVVGLLVNVIGVLFFHDAHSHSHGHGGCSAKVDHNLRGVYLHILADLLGSVSVMISSVIIYMTGIRIADPICSAVSSFFIAISAFPLLSETGKVLLLSNRSWSTELFCEKISENLRIVEGVHSINDIVVWTESTSPRESMFCMVRLSAFSDVDKNFLRCRVKSYMKRVLAAEVGTCHLDIYVHIEE